MILGNPNPFVMLDQALVLLGATHHNFLRGPTPDRESHHRQLAHNRAYPKAEADRLLFPTRNSESCLY